MVHKKNKKEKKKKKLLKYIAQGDSTRELHKSIFDCMLTRDFVIQDLACRLN